MDYEVKLEIFEGPLDLLLHLIHKNEVDIFDIPIAAITDQYLEYLDMMKALNINLVGDFLIMASTLIYIKSKMLLPQTGSAEDEEDPRDEIMRPLLEYMQYKELAQELSEREMLDRDVFVRKSLETHSLASSEEAQLDVSLFQLIDAFKRVIDNQLPGVQLQFRLEKWSIKEKMEHILSRLKEKENLFFKELFDGDRAISEFVVTFLALLELVHLGLIRLYQPTVASEIKVDRIFEENGRNGDG